MTECYATQAVMNISAQGILHIATNPSACVPDVFVILEFVLSVIKLALRTKYKVELSRFNKSIKVNKFNKNNDGERFVNLTESLPLT